MNLRAGFLLGALACLASWADESEPGALVWEELAELPDPEGFAGSYAGVTQGALLVAGGANFPDKRPWDGGSKVWHDTVFVLESPSARWRMAGRLPRRSGYGLSVTIPDGLLLIGGGDEKENFTTVLLAKWDGQHVTFESWPALPYPLAMAAGALADRTIYVAGGTDQPDISGAKAVFLALDLDDPAQGWRELEPWPGPPLTLAAAGVLQGSFYLFGGIGDRPAREWFRGCYAYTPGKGWRRLADLPRGAGAAPAQAVAVGTSLLVLGGDDGGEASLPLPERESFPRDVLAYDSLVDSWSRVDQLPFSLAATPLVWWKGRIIVPGGETRPGVRSPKIWSSVITAEK